MIISHKHRYIFLHNPKTAGSSVAAYLSLHLGPKDIMADSWEDALPIGAKRNRRFYFDALHWQLFPSAVRFGIGNLIKQHDVFLLDRLHRRVWRGKLNGEYAHAVADSVRKLDPRIFQTYFKFSFVRNPYGQALSLYEWWTKVNRHSPIGFSEFLERLFDPTRPDPERMRRANVWSPTGREIYTINDQIAVDHIAKFENIECEMRYICERIGIRFDPNKLPQAKKLGHENRYRDYYTKRDKEIVERLWHHVFEHFNYSF